MSTRGGNFFEEHIEKMVFAIIGAVCIWLLISRVLFSPNVISYDATKFSPSEIDGYILSKHVEPLKEKLNSEPEPLPPYEPNIGKFGEIMNVAIDIDVNLYWPQPILSLTDFRDKRKYHLPWVGEVTDAALEYIRAVAYVPTEEITKENIYNSSNSEPNDIDFVTVEAKFDFAGLIKNFYESFAGDEVQQDWRDPCLAKPVFAAVQLQRQEQFADGSWSDWQIVPRTKIDHQKKMFEVIEDVAELPPGGIKVRMLQFDNAQVRADLLQPTAYRIASAREEWFPPSLHQKFLEWMREQEMEEKRRAKEEEEERREQEREEARAEREQARAEREQARTGTGDYLGGQLSRRSTTTRSLSDRRSERLSGLRGERRSSVRGERLGELGSAERWSDRGRLASRRQERQERREQEKERLAKSREASKTTSIDDIYDEMAEVWIAEKTDLADKTESLLFWAHDDTVEPKKNYRYRIRLGVFNPIAGTNQVSEEDKHLQNKVVLWSDFSDVTETVDIPARLYFFPHDLQEAAKIVTVKVCKYTLGYWYGKDFAVKQGEVIGKVAETETADDEQTDFIVSMVPEMIDYSTGAVLVDVMPVNDWWGGKSLYARHYFNMLYSFDGKDIGRIPIGARYWAKGLMAQFDTIEKAAKQPKEPFRAWDSQIGGQRYRTARPRFDEYAGRREYYEEDY